MRIPVMHGIIDRRILVNYRVKPDVLVRMLPKPFRLKLVKGVGIAGVCLIRLKRIRPRFLPAFVGISSENAAHRIAVEWDDRGETKEGVFVPRRDTSSRINAFLGGRLFPGMQKHADFKVQEHDDHYRIECASDDQQTHLLVEGHLADKLPKTSVFRSISEASQFFERGSLGYSVTPQEGQYDALELHSFNWRVRPLDVENVKSSFFDNPELFPVGSVDFDSALLMEGIEHEWHGGNRLSSGSPCG